MGNHSSRNSNGNKNKQPPDETNAAKPKFDGMSRSSSGADIQERAPSQLLPIEKLAKILIQKSQKEDSVHGITSGAFARCVFPKYIAFGEKLFYYLHSQIKSKTKHLSSSAFKQQCERYLSLMDDDLIREIYVRMFAYSHGAGENNNGDIMQRTNLNDLLMTCYRLAMDHYCDGPQTCLFIQRTLNSVVNSCFHSKDSLSTQFVVHWLAQNCPRLLFPLHRYAVHALTTSYRLLERDNSNDATGVNLSTPVLEQNSILPSVKKQKSLMPVSEAWLLASALPAIYSLPQSLPTPNGSSSSFTSHAFLSKLIAAVPSHWVLLYDSDEHGLGANRFMHHVLAYRGPTLLLFRANDGNVFCIASPQEWRETHLYWGDANSCCLQLLPNFSLLEKHEKMLYFNTNIRGYPLGLRGGSDPRKPILSVNAGFDKIEFKSIPYNLFAIEVWGCGDQASREKQLDIKQWQVKEAERQRHVKLSAADWLDHPDRYLLELAGRQNYNNDLKS